MKPILAVFLVAFVLLAGCLPITVNAAAVIKDRNKFKCEVCFAFSKEYETRIVDKETDDHPDLLNAMARGNASNYLWDKNDQKLIPREWNRGEEAIEEIYEVLDKDILTHQAVEITLHALHAAAHRKTPPKAPWSFNWQVLCVETLKVCKENKDIHHDRSYEILRHDYESFKHHFQSPHSHQYDDLEHRHFVNPEDHDDKDWHPGFEEGEPHYDPRYDEDDERRNHQANLESMKPPHASSDGEIEDDANNDL